MKFVRINDRLAVSDQPEAADFAGLAREGFKGIVNARPDGEELSQPGNHREAVAAESANLSYAFVPVTNATITIADVRAFQTAIRNTNGPVLAHCKTGMRALSLHAIGEVLDGRMDRQVVQAFGKSHGFDLSGALRWLDRYDANMPRVEGFYDPRTNSIQYVVADPVTKDCAIIDPVFDFDEKSGATATTQADAILEYVRNQGLRVSWILDTHPHADHFSAAYYLKQKTGARTGIGSHVVNVQRLWKDIYNWPELLADGSQWDCLFADDETFNIGSLQGRIMFSPGHTLASVTYLIGDAAFVHDTIFMPDSGTARADFPGGSAKDLWRSIQRIIALPEQTRLFTGHDYQPGGRNPRWESSVAEQKQSNHHLVGMTEDRFVTVRTARDKTMPMPKLILHALQVNLRAGQLPDPENNGRRYLKVPIGALADAAW